MTLRLLIATVFVGVAALAITMLTARAQDGQPKSPATQPAGPLDFTLDDIDGKPANLSDYRGKVVLLVNVASRCGNTPQYEGLEKLYRQHKDQGLVVIGIPANNFGGQEPGTNEQIKQFCSTKYDVTFPMMSKISVKGDDKHPLYKYLTESPTAGAHAGEVTWNFAKFLIGRDGQVVARFDPKTRPEDPQITSAIQSALDPNQ
jgi:glutathione peroxidase